MTPWIKSMLAWGGVGCIVIGMRMIHPGLLFIALGGLLLWKGTEE